MVFDPGPCRGRLVPFLWLETWQLKYLLYFSQLTHEPVHAAVGTLVYADRLLWEFRILVDVWEHLCQSRIEDFRWENQHASTGGSKGFKEQCFFRQRLTLQYSRGRPSIYLSSALKFLGGRGDIFAFLYCSPNPNHSIQIILKVIFQENGSLNVLANFHAGERVGGI